MKGLVFVLLGTCLCLSAAEYLTAPQVQRLFGLAPKETTRLESFHFSNCMPKDQELAIVSNATLQPDPLPLPGGNLTIGFHVDLKINVTAWLMAEVEFYMMFAGKWLILPCDPGSRFGSCTYDDVCLYLYEISKCPDAFVANNVPCKCPFYAGNYTLPPSVFNVPLEKIFQMPANRYLYKAKLNFNGIMLGCYEFQVTLKDKN